MPRVKCFNCETVWELSDAATNRCPGPECGWITEIYYDESRAKEVARIYNSQDPSLPQSGVCPLEGINGYSVSFPDQGRLAEVAERLLDADSR